MTQEDKTPEEIAIEELTRVAEDLSTHLQRLDKQYKNQVVDVAKYGQTNRKLISGLAISLILDVLLTFFLVNNAFRINDVTDRLDYSQSVQRQGALCPLYQIFLDSQSPQARARADDPKKYDEAFKTIREGYNRLQCGQAGNLTPPFYRPPR